MKSRNQFDLPAGDTGPVLTHRLEPVDARNCTPYEIPGGNMVAVKVESHELLIVADLGAERC